MSIIASIRTFFSPGEGITSDDLNAISLNTTRRAWEAPGYAYLTGFDEVSASGLRSYADAFDGDSSAMYARMRGVFTVGRGLEPSFTGLWSGVGSGFLGVWNDPSGPTPPPASGSNRMIWASVSGGDIAVTHSPASSGKTRWDLICVTPREVDAAMVTRDFKDATTGALTSETVVPGKGYTFDLNHIEGDEASSNPTVPSVPTGKYAVYAVMVGNTEITKAWDFTVPVGTLKSGIVLGREGSSFGAAAWAPQDSNTGLASEVSVGGDALIFPPANVRGSVDGLLLGIKLSHRLYSGCSVFLSAFPTGAAGGLLVNLATLTASVTMDGTDRVKTLDFRGTPYSDQTQPIWLNGTNKKGASDYALCLRVTAPDTTNVSVIKHVQWYTL